MCFWLSLSRHRVTIFKSRFDFGLFIYFWLLSRGLIESGNCLLTRNLSASIRKRTRRAHEGSKTQNGTWHPQSQLFGSLLLALHEECIQMSISNTAGGQGGIGLLKMPLSSLVSEKIKPFLRQVVFHLSELVNCWFLTTYSPNSYLGQSGLS